MRYFDALLAQNSQLSFIVIGARLAARQLASERMSNGMIEWIKLCYDARRRPVSTHLTCLCKWKQEKEIYGACRTVAPTLNRPVVAKVRNMASEFPTGIQTGDVVSQDIMRCNGKHLVERNRRSLHPGRKALAWAILPNQKRAAVTAVSVYRANPTEF